MDSLASLEVYPGEELSASKWNALVRQVEARTLRRTSTVRLNRGPDGTKASFVGGRKSDSLPQTSLRVSVSADEKGKTIVTVSKGLIAGKEPEVDKVPVSRLDAEGNPPVFIIDPAKAIDAKTGIGMLYARVHLYSDWSVEKIELEAAAKPPGITAWRGYKLLAFLRREPADDPEAPIIPIQRVFFDLGHTTSRRASNGKARHWFWAV